MPKHSQETQLQSRHRVSGGPDPMMSSGTQRAVTIKRCSLRSKWWLPGAPSLRHVYFHGGKAQDWNVSAHSHALGRPDLREPLWDTHNQTVISERSGSSTEEGLQKAHLEEERAVGSHL